MFVVVVLFGLVSDGVLATSNTCNETSEYIQTGTGIFQGSFWNAKADDFGQCARACVRRKPCVSLTYDTRTYMCYLSTLTMNNADVLKRTTLLYAEIEMVPFIVDGGCFSRPCGDNETCIPGSLADGHTECSFSCIRNSDSSVCPLPKALNGYRSVGSRNEVTCPHGYRGGGQATCQDDLRWSHDVQPCQLIHHSPCISSDNCSAMLGSCIDGICKCALGLVYSPDNLKCICSDGWLEFKQSCYLFVDSPLKDQTNAIASCNNHGGMLAEIHDQEEDEFIHQECVNRGRGYRIGAMDEVVEGSWGWTGSNTPAIYQNWGTNEPNNYNNKEDCAMAGPNDWYDVKCFDTRSYLCEIVIQ